MSTTYPPDGWEMLTGTWGSDGDVDHDTVTTFTGLSTIKFKQAGSDTSAIMSPYIPALNGERFDIRLWVKSMHATMHGKIYVRSYDEAKNYLGDYTAVFDGDLGSSGYFRCFRWVHETVYLAKQFGFIRVVIARNGGTDSDMYYGGMSLAPAKRKFAAHLSTNQTVHTGEATVVGLTTHGGGWDTEYSHGFGFNSERANAFQILSTLPYGENTSSYVFQMHFDAIVVCGDAVAGNWFKVTIARSGASIAVSGGTAAGGIVCIPISCDMALTGTDYVELMVDHNHGADLTLNATECRFSGHEID